MPRVDEDWAGKFALINTADDTPLAVYPSRDHRNFPNSMEINGVGIVSPFKSASLALMAAVDIYPLIDDVPAHDPGWQQPEKAGLKNNVNHYVQLYTLREKSPSEVVINKRQLIDVERARLENSGFYYKNVPYDSDPKSIQRITGAPLSGLVTDKLNRPDIHAILTALGITPPVISDLNWTAGDNSIQVLTEVDVLLFSLTAAQYIESVFASAQNHKASVETMYNNGETAQAIWQYDHSAGWPISAGLGGVG